MSRDDALNRLRGTWQYLMEGGKVLIRDVALLEAVREVEREAGVTHYHRPDIEPLPRYREA